MARGVNRMDAQDKELKRFGKSINQSGSVDNKPLSLKEQLKQMDTKPNVTPLYPLGLNVSSFTGSFGLTL